jgi:uncharacterized protein (TIGR02996 family)
MTTEEKGFLLALEQNPDDTTARAAFADWLEEHGRRYEAILQRGEAGISEVFFKLRRKSDGLFSDCNTHRPDGWSTTGKMWHKLSSLRAHMASYEHSHRWGDTRGPIPYLGNTAWDDLEVVVVELRLVEGTTLPVRCESAREGNRLKVTITVDEPLGPAGEGR